MTALILFAATAFELGSPPPPPDRAGSALANDKLSRSRNDKHTRRIRSRRGRARSISTQSLRPSQRSTTTTIIDSFYLGAISRKTACLHIMLYTRRTPASCYVYTFRTRRRRGGSGVSRVKYHRGAVPKRRGKKKKKISRDHVLQHVATTADAGRDLPD